MMGSDQDNTILTDIRQGKHIQTQVNTDPQQPNYQQPNYQQPNDQQPNDQLLRKLENAIDGFLSKDSMFKPVTGQRPPAFHSEFPKKATSLDNDELYIDMQNDFLVRWIPRDTLRMIFPALYFQDLIDKLKKERKSRTRKVEIEFFGGYVPTRIEKETCKQINGKGYWARDGTWFCTCQEIDENKTKDSFGPSFFQTYNQWLLWHHSMKVMIEKAREEGDTKLLSEIAKANTSGLVK